MARKPRIHFSGAVYHVLLRGLDDKTIFRTVGDRRAWEALVEEGCERFGHTVHAFCWMKDHVQMAIEVADAPLSKIMQNLSFRYTRHFNKQHGEEGPLFHGRYKAILIDPDEYLDDLVRFIHNNPRQERHGEIGRRSQVVEPRGLPRRRRPRVGHDRDGARALRQDAALGGSAFERFVAAGRDEGERQDLMRGPTAGACSVTPASRERR